MAKLRQQEQEINALSQRNCSDCANLLTIRDIAGLYTWRCVHRDKNGVVVAVSVIATEYDGTYPAQINACDRYIQKLTRKNQMAGR